MSAIGFIPAVLAHLVRDVLYDRLAGDAGLAALGCAVHDRPPVGVPAHPYVLIGDEASESRLDTMRTSGKSVDQIVYAYTREYGYDQLQDVSAAVVRALDAEPLLLAGHAHTHTWHEGSDFSRDTDGYTRRAAIRFRVEAREA